MNVKKQKSEINKQVLAFNASYKLVAVFNSIKEASSVTGIVRQSIIKAINGTTISANSHYWRILPDEYIIDNDDMGTLSLISFDLETECDRKIYATRKMKRAEVILESEWLEKRKHK